MKVSIIFGSETGNAESFADTAAEKVKAAGLEAEIKSMEDVKIDDLASMSNLLIITSTWGDGDPPSNAWDLWGALGNKPKIDLSGLHYSVCALGDKSYPQFCKCGVDFDDWLEELGAKRVHSRAECDWDFEADANAWLDAVVPQLVTLAPSA